MWGGIERECGKGGRGRGEGDDRCVHEESLMKGSFAESGQLSSFCCDLSSRKVRFGFEVLHWGSLITITVVITYSR